MLCRLGVEAIMRGRQLAIVVTVACAAALGDLSIASAQIQLVPSGGQTRARPASPPAAAQPRSPDARPAQRSPSARQGGEQRRGPGRRGQRQTPAATEAAPGETAAPSNFPRRLDQRTIRGRFFNGQPINARALGGGLFTLVFHEDGRMERTSPNGEVRTGRWRFLGDAYCSRWDPTPPTGAPPPSAAATPPSAGRQGGRRSSGARQPAPRLAPEVCHTVVQEGTTIRVVRNTRAVATWAHEGTPPPP
jgi:hypothetical protein